MKISFRSLFKLVLAAILGFTVIALSAEKRVWTVGDSNTKGIGFGGSSGGMWNYRMALKWLESHGHWPLPFTCKFVGTQDKTLDQYYGGPHDGHPGWSAAGAHSHIQDWLEEITNDPNQGYPEIILLMFGTNDFGGSGTNPGISADQLVSDIRVLAFFIKIWYNWNGLPYPQIYIGNVFPRSGSRRSTGIPPNQQLILTWESSESAFNQKTKEYKAKLYDAWINQVGDGWDIVAGLIDMRDYVVGWELGSHCFGVNVFSDYNPSRGIVPGVHLNAPGKDVMSHEGWLVGLAGAGTYSTGWDETWGKYDEVIPAYGTTGFRDCGNRYQGSYFITFMPWQWYGW